MPNETQHDMLKRLCKTHGSYKMSGTYSLCVRYDPKTDKISFEKQ